MLKTFAYQSLTGFAHAVRQALAPPDQRPPYGYAWDVYPRWVRRVSRLLFARTDDDFQRSGVKIGGLSSDALQSLREAIDRAPPRLIRTADHDEGYEFNAGLGDYERILNRDHVYVQLGADQAAALRRVIRLLRRPVAAALGSPWRVVNTRCWKTSPSASESGPNAWHADGFPVAAPKLMIYLTGAGPSLGSTEIRALDGTTIFVEGPPGMWVLFRNGDLQHRGIAPQVGERIILELTLAPALRFDATPVFAGLNAKYPRRPWYRTRNKTGYAFPPAEAKCR